MADHKKWTCIDLAIAAYFMGMVGSGIVGIPPPTVIEEQPPFDKITVLAFSGAMILTGIGGIMASLARSRQGEFIAIVVMAFLTVVQGLILFDDDLQASLRLLFAPLMMVSFAFMRKGFNLSKRDVDRIKLRLRRGLEDE